MALTGPWLPTNNALRTLARPAHWRNATEKSILKECHRLRTLMVESFNNSGPKGKKWKALSVYTQLVSRALGRGDRKPLMHTGDLRNSHTVVQEDKDFFVGVHRKAKSKDGESIVNIGLVHEKGAGPITINVTDKMRRFFKFLHIFS